MNDSLRINSVEACKSAQQQVWIVELEYPYDALTNSWKKACFLENFDKDGRDGETCATFQKNEGEPRVFHQCVVIRQWQGGCRWWNLHRNESVSKLAQMELDGYQTSREALLRQTSNATNYSFGSTNQGVIIPRVFHSELVEPHSDTFFEDETNKNHPGRWNPWAIFEYVGPKSIYFDETTAPYDSLWMDSMIQIRPEFGFEEPHPRWGRLPESQALEYVRLILHQIVLPLHSGSKQVGMGDTTSDDENDDYVYVSYEKIVDVCQQAHKELMAHLVAKAYHQPHDYDSQTVKRWNETMELVQVGVEDVLPACAKTIPTSPYWVLVHMDLQPQNILFSRRPSTGLSQVVSVLDWEDAAMADPRFELLLLGRKVCANRPQAEIIWDEYSQQTKVSLGPLLPWLQLESMHSLLTMLLQSMDKLNGGRNPWESSDDLWGKIEREMKRWKSMLTEKDEAVDTPTISQNRAHHEVSKDGYDSLADLGIDPTKCFRQDP